MRRMRLNVLAVAVALFGIAMSSTQVTGQVLINLTNQVWKYDQSGTDPGAFWDPAYVDDAWLEGRGIFAAETSADANLSANVYPYTNTVILAPGGRTVDYFRTRFNFSGGGNLDHYALVASNLIDDAYVMYLNGVEVGRYNMNPTDDNLAAAANPAGEGVYVTRELCIPTGTLVVGENVLAVRVHQNAGTSSDVVWGTWLHANLATSPSFTSPTAPVNIALAQGRSTNLTVAVINQLCGTMQWYFNNGSGAVAIPDATNATYTVADMDLSKAGSYFVRAENRIGPTDSPSFNVTFDQDIAPPVVRSVSGNPAAPLMITVTFSEDIIDLQDATIDEFSFYLQEVDNTGNTIGVTAADYGTSSNIVVLTLFEARAPAVKYELVIIGTIEDRYGNPLANPTVARVTDPVLLQEGLNGYASTIDTEVRFSAPDSAAGANAATVNADLADGTPSGPVHSLLRFDSLIGGGANQVPFGAIINKAELRIYTDDQTTAAGLIRLGRMNVAWDESSTWNSLGNGIDQTNGVEISTIDAIINGAQDNSFDTLDVTAAVQAWANGSPNYGWAFLPSATDGWRWATSENGTPDQRPRLLVDFTVVQAPCNIQDQPDSQTIPEKSPLTLSVVSAGSDLTYQWYFDPAGAPVAFSAIPGATASSYTVSRAVPANSGTYYVVVQNNVPSSCTSAQATVTVTPDTQAPALTSALGNRDQTTISLTFNDTLNPATAGNPATYSLSGGLSISGVAIGANGSSVTLTSSAPRVVGQNYTLTITGLRDDSVAQNVIAPNPTVTNLAQQIVLMPFNTTQWKYETNGLDLGTAWKETGYNDSAWPAGTALLGFETTQATLDGLAAQGLNTNNATLWSLMRPDGTTNITWYLRSAVNIPYDVSGATITLRQVIDDGSVYYFNGTERFRFDMPAGDVTYLTEAVSATGENVIRSQNLTNISCGANTIAVSVHNDSPTSTDILFAAELLGTFPTFSTCSAGGATLSIVNNANGTVTLSWVGSGTLQESTDLTNWTPAANQNNPQTFTPVGLKFYKVQ